MKGGFGVELKRFRALSGYLRSMVDCMVDVALKLPQDIERSAVGWRSRSVG